MVAKQDHRPLIIALALVIFALSTCVVCAGLFYVLWNIPLGQDLRTGPVPRPAVAITAQNVGKLEKLHEFSQRAGYPVSRLVAR